MHWFWLGYLKFILFQYIGEVYRERGVIRDLIKLLAEMKYSGFKIGRIPVTAKLLLYTLLTISVVSGIVGNSLMLATNNVSSLDFFIFYVLMGVGAMLAGIGFVAIILEVARRWQRVGGGLFIGIAIFIFASLPSGFNEELRLFHDHPYIIAPVLIINISWLISGIIIILRGNFLSTKAEV